MLRGPQGTLYGRNSTGGAITVISKAPKLGEVGGYLTGELGNYGLQRFIGAVNIPAGDDLAFRAAVQITDRGGYLTDGGSDDKSQAGRLRALWEPSADLTVNLIVEGAHSGGKGFGRVYRPALFGNPWTAARDPRITLANFPLLTNRAPRIFNDVNYFGVTGQVDWDLGGTVLTVLPAYKYVAIDGIFGTDLYFVDHARSHQTSLEVRLGGESDRLKWVVGLYGFSEDLSTYNSSDRRPMATLTGQVSVFDNPELDSKSGAAFGEATLSVSDNLRFVAGLRYTYEQRTRDGEIITNVFNSDVLQSTSVTPLVNQKVELNALTWRTGLEIDLSHSSLLYLTVSKGVKSGGFSITAPDSFDAEYVTAYTLGVKNQLFSNTLRFNLEGFYWKYRDQQIGAFTTSPAGILGFLTLNAGQSTIYGAGLEIVWAPTAADTLSLGTEYLHTNYDSFVFSTPGAFPAGTVLVDGCVSGGSAGGALYFKDCSNNPLPRSPRFSGNARYTHEFDLGGENNLVLGGAVAFESKSYLFFNYVSPNYQQSTYALFDADITFNAGDRWSLQAWIRNIGDKAVYQSASDQSSIAPTTGPTRGAITAINAPRTYGVKLRYNF